VWAYGARGYIARFISTHLPLMVVLAAYSKQLTGEADKEEAREDS